MKTTNETTGFENEMLSTVEHSAADDMASDLICEMISEIKEEIFANIDDDVIKSIITKYQNQYKAKHTESGCGFDNIEALNSFSCETGDTEKFMDVVEPIIWEIFSKW